MVAMLTLLGRVLLRDLTARRRVGILLAELHRRRTRGMALVWQQLLLTSVCDNGDDGGETDHLYQSPG